MTWVIHTLRGSIGSYIKIGPLTIAGRTLAITSCISSISSWSSGIWPIPSWSSCIRTITIATLSNAWLLAIHINISLLSKIMRLVLLHHEILLILDIFLFCSSSLLHFSFISVLDLFSLFLSLLSCLLLSKCLVSFLFLFYPFFLFFFVCNIL